MVVADDSVVASAAEYRSRFGNWERRASVRTKPRRVLDGEDRAGLFFPPELTPVTAHPLVCRLPAATVDGLTVRRLYQYLQFTTELEIRAVVPVTLAISLGRSGLALPAPMRADAFKITTDETWHAQFSDDLIRQIEQETGVAPRLPPVPRFVERLEVLRHRAGPGLGPLCDLVFAVVSETLISAILSDIPKDDRLRTAVRETVADHAEDEGRHHAYFRSLLTYLWPAMSAAERRTLGPLVPELVRCFLEPDHSATVYALLDVGVPDDAVGQIIADSYPEREVTAAVRAAARSTVRYFTGIGALDDAGTHAAFVVAGLLDN